MITVRKSEDRGHANHGWLDAHHTFSFAEYRDPEHMGFRTLRVLNQDQVAPGQGFGTHGHRDMEIVSIVLEGAMAHKDNLGNGSTMVPGEVQRMSAGSGVTHSEFNASPTDPLHLLQIWILPEERGLPPSYDQRTYSEEGKRDRLQLVISPDGEDDSLRVHQDVRLYRSKLTPGSELEHTFDEGRAGWIQVTEGVLTVNGTELTAGDGASLESEPNAQFRSAGGAEFLLFDLN